MYPCNMHPQLPLAGTGAKNMAILNSQWTLQVHQACMQELPCAGELWVQEEGAPFGGDALALHGSNPGVHQRLGALTQLRRAPLVQLADQPATARDPTASSVC
jgi:hypothetical protein